MVTAVVLAAGASTRMGTHKLLLPLGGEALVRRTVRHVSDAGFDEVLVIVGHEHDRVLASLQDLNVRHAINGQYETGMGSSFRAAVESMPESAAAMFALADQPLLAAADYRRLLDAYQAKAAGIISVSVLTGGCTREELEAAGTHVVLNDLTEFPGWLEEHLLAHRLLGGDPRHLEQARTLGRRIEPVFWNQVLGGYDLEAGIPQVFTVYSAWLTQSLLLLYQHENDPAWLRRATANVDALNEAAWDAAHGGYYRRYYVCRDRLPPGCEDGAEQATATTEKHSVDQAWMQRVQALLATASLQQTPPAQLPRAR